MKRSTLLPLPTEINIFIFLPCLVLCIFLYFHYYSRFSSLFIASLWLHAHNQKVKPWRLNAIPKIFEWLGKTRPEDRRRGRESKQLDIFYRQMSKASWMNFSCLMIRDQWNVRDTQYVKCYFSVLQLNMTTPFDINYQCTCYDNDQPPNEV